MIEVAVGLRSVISLALIGLSTYKRTTSLTSSPLFWFSLVVGSFRNRFVASNIW